MKNTKRRMEFFSFYDYTGMETHLEKMAQKGWLLERISPFTWTYRRIEPADLPFTVTCFPDASLFDPEPSEQQKAYWESCEQKGWQLAASRGHIQVFYSEEKEPFPLETDASRQVASIHRVARKSYLPGSILLLAALLFQAALFFHDFWEQPASILSDNTQLYRVVLWTILPFIEITELFGYFHWYLKAKKAAVSDGSFVKTHSPYRLIQTLFLVLLIGFCLLLLSYFTMGTKKGLAFGILPFAYIALFFFPFFGLMNWLKKKKMSADASQGFLFCACIFLSIFLIVGMDLLTTYSMLSGWLEEQPAETYEYHGATYEVHNDPLPLTVEDLDPRITGDYSCEASEESTFLVSKFKGWQSPRMDTSSGCPDLHYTIYTFRFDGLYTFCRKRMVQEAADLSTFRTAKLFPSDASIWNAKLAYRYFSDNAYEDRFLVCYPNRIIDICLDWELTEDQIRIAAKHLAD